jgi:hypothetical protein
MHFWKILRYLALGLLITAAGIQFVPYGRDHTNPPVTQEPRWNSGETRQLAVRACYDCHSNETVWPWYSHVAPVSWLVQRDVDRGRKKMNFSEWDRPQDEGDDSARKVRKGSMPPWYYPWAQLSSAERSALIEELEAIQPVEKEHKRERRRESRRRN